MDIIERRKHELLCQIIEDTKKFLAENSNLKFYSFAFDCNAEYAGILLCFNTEEAFAKTLTHYQNGTHGHLYQTDEQINELRFNCGDWDFQGFADYTVFTEDELIEMYQDDYDKLYTEMMNFNYMLMQAFFENEIYSLIPKTKNFQILCIDHDEDVDHALMQTQKIIHTAQEK